MTDRYTKAVLTVIAGALVALLVQNGSRSAVAQGGLPAKVQICDGSGAQCAGLDWVWDCTQGQPCVSRRGLQTFALVKKD